MRLQIRKLDRHGDRPVQNPSGRAKTPRSGPPGRETPPIPLTFRGMRGAPRGSIRSLFLLPLALSLLALVVLPNLLRREKSPSTKSNPRNCPRSRTRPRKRPSRSRRPEKARPRRTIRRRRLPKALKALPAKNRKKAPKRKVADWRRHGRQRWQRRAPGGGEVPRSATAAGARTGSAAPRKSNPAAAPRLRAFTRLKAAVVVARPRWCRS